METFVLDLESPLSELPDIGNKKLVQRDETTIEADIGRDESINVLFEELSKHNIKVLSMRNKTNRLEELFMNLVESGKGNRAAS